MENIDSEITFPLKIRRSLWEKFKSFVPRPKSLNTSLLELIEREVSCKRK